MQVLLIHPPVNDPRSPRLALPSLAAFLRKSGIRTQLLDLDLESLLAVLRPDNVEHAGRTVRSKFNNTQLEHSSRFKRLIELSESLVDYIRPALDILRDANRFYNSGDLSAARDVVFDCVELIAAASKRPVRYRLDLLQYDVDGVDPTRFSDLVFVSADREANLFADYWENEVFPALQRETWDLIGISIPTRMQIIPGLTLARELRRRGYYVVIGGTFFTKFIDRLVRMPEFFDYFADAVVVYEGETALIELLNQLAGKKELAKVPNLLFREKNWVRLSNLHVENIASLPTPDFNGLPLDRYLSPKRVLPVLLGKGCYWNKCKFCDSSRVYRILRKAYRLRPPEVFVEDVVHLRQQFECEHFLFTDEAVPPQLLEKVAEAFLARDVRGIHFAAYARLEPGFTKEVCRKVAAMGMKMFFFGLESGCQATLDHMAKGIKIKNVRIMLQRCSNAGIRFHVFSMIGFPEESEESARRTAAFFEENKDVLDHPGNSFDIHLLELQLRTPYFEEASQMGVRIPKYLISGDFVVGVGTHWKNTRGLTSKRVKELLKEFGERLHEVYTYYDSWPSLLWPVLEEWALLYGVEYATRSYPFRLSLPEEDNEKLCRLRWNPLAHIRRYGLAVHFTTRRASINVSEQLYETIKKSNYLSIHELACILDQKRHDLDLKEMATLRRSIEVLLRSNVLQLRCRTSETV